MSDLKLFCLEGDGVRELEGQSVAIEKSLQNLMEKNLQDFLNIRFVAIQPANLIKEELTPLDWTRTTAL
jgi:hypothetical protein